MVVVQRFNFVVLKNRDQVGHTVCTQTKQLRFIPLSGEEKAAEVTSSFGEEKSNGVNNNLLRSDTPNVVGSAEAVALIRQLTDFVARSAKPAIQPDR